MAVLAQTLAPAPAFLPFGGAGRWLLENPYVAQWFCTLVLLASWAVHRINIPRHEPGFWQAASTRVAVTAIGVGGLVSLGDCTMETALADTPIHQSAVTLVADTNYTTAALIIPPIAHSLARCLPTLQAPHGSRLRHLVRLLLEARCSWPVMVASVLTGTLILILAPPTISGVRVDVTAWGWSYRIAMNLMSSLYAATICGALMHAYLVARNPVQVLEPAVRQPRRLPKFHAPSTASTPATRDAAIIRLDLHDPLAHRWKYLALSMAGFSALVCVPFLMPLLAVLYPGPFIALNIGALSPQRGPGFYPDWYRSLPCLLPAPADILLRSSLDTLRFLQEAHRALRPPTRILASRVRRERSRLGSYRRPYPTKIDRALTGLESFCVRKQGLLQCLRPKWCARSVVVSPQRPEPQDVREVKKPQLRAPVSGLE